jgi:hypothetical protein
LGSEEVGPHLISMGSYTDWNLRRKYHELKDEWYGVPEVFDRSDIVEV